LFELELAGAEDILIQLLKLSEDNLKVPEQVVLSVFVMTEVLSIASENVTVMLSVIDTELWLSVGDIKDTVGAVVSITNEFIFRVTLFPAESVTVIVQYENVPSLKEFIVIVLLSVVAEVVLEEQDPPYVMVPASEDEKV
jgi:hypothetical protein